MLTNFRRARNLRRYHSIVSVLARHGFGSVLEALQVNRYLPLPPRLLKQRVETAQKSPAVHLRLALEELGPTFIKLGQILSTRPDLLPPQYIVELSRLQDGVPPIAWEQIQGVLREEYACEPDEIFAAMDPVPLGSASLAQVHAAALQNGDEVVVKIQRPGISAMIDADLDILTDLAGIAQRTKFGQLYDIAGIVEHFAFTLKNELDYRREGLNADRFRSNFEGEPYLYIPKVYWEVSTPRVLVLERLCGLKLNPLDDLVREGVDLEAVAHRSAAVVVKEIMEDGFFHADPHPGNFVVLLRPRSETETGAQPAEQPEISLGVMDFGMVGHISKTDRLNLVQAVYLASKFDAPGVVEHMLRMGAIHSQVDVKALERDVERIFNRYQGLPLKHIQARQVLEEVMHLAFRYRITLPPDLWLLFKTLTMMDGLVRQLDPEFDIFAVFEPQIRRVFVENRLPWVWGPTFMADLESLALMLKELPSMGEGMLRGLQRGEFPFTIQMGATKETMDRLDRVSTRFSLSVLTAAFILGLALLLPLASGNTLTAVLAAIGFLAALLLGFWIVFSIMRSGK